MTEQEAWAAYNEAQELEAQLDAQIQLAEFRIVSEAGVLVALAHDAAALASSLNRMRDLLDSRKKLTEIRISHGRETTARLQAWCSTAAHHQVCFEGMSDVH